MRKYLLPSALILLIGLGYGVAQNINKALQLSQSPGAFGVDASNNVYFPAHVLNVGKAPTVSSCGTSPTLATGSSDFSGTITGGTNHTACTLTFRTAYGAAPTCVAAGQSSYATSPIAYNAVATGINFTTFSGTDVVNYICSGAQ